MISIIVSLCLAYGFAQTKRLMTEKGVFERAKRGAIIGLFCGLIFAIPALVISKVVSLIILVGATCVGIGTSITDPKVDGIVSSTYMTFTILYGYFNGILKTSSIKRISYYVDKYMDFNISTFKKDVNDDNAKRLIDTVLKKDNWVTMSDINIKSNPNVNVASSVNKAAQKQILDVKNKVKEQVVSNIDELVKYDFDYTHDDVYGNGVIKKQCKLIDGLIKYINTKTKNGKTFKFIMNDIYRHDTRPHEDPEPLD